MQKYIRKADIILFIALVIIGLAASAALTLSHGEAGSSAKVVIESEGKLYARYPLAEARTVEVPSKNGGYNMVVISGGSVAVSEASCKNQVCVKHGAISRTGESIVCLPNRLVVRIENGSEEGGGYDSVTS